MLRRGGKRRRRNKRRKKRRKLRRRRSSSDGLTRNHGAMAESSTGRPVNRGGTTQKISDGETRRRKRRRRNKRRRKRRELRKRRRHSSDGLIWNHSSLPGSSTRLPVNRGATAQQMIDGATRMRKRSGSNKCSSSSSSFDGLTLDLDSMSEF